MSGKPNGDRRAVRRAETRAEIVAGAWELAQLDLKPEPAEFIRQSTHRCFDFCTQNPVRFQLLFQRTIPGFVPSQESWQIALDAAVDMYLSHYHIPAPASAR